MFLLHLSYLNVNVMSRLTKLYSMNGQRLLDLLEPPEIGVDETRPNEALSALSFLPQLFPIFYFVVSFVALREFVREVRRRPRHGSRHSQIFESQRQQLLYFATGSAALPTPGDISHDVSAAGPTGARNSLHHY